MDGSRRATCAEPTQNAQVVCAGCGELLPQQVVVISEGSPGGGFALVKEVKVGENADSQEAPAVPAGKRATMSVDKEANL